MPARSIVANIPPRKWTKRPKEEIMAIDLEQLSIGTIRMPAMGTPMGRAPIAHTPGWLPAFPADRQQCAGPAGMLSDLRR
jgi:hypothetical protein